MATLDVLNGKGAGTTIDLDQFAGKDRIVLGNRRTAAVPVRDPWVNFVHAEIHREGDTYRIADKRSKAGTFVNGSQVGTSGQVLSNGDMIALGKTQLRFKDSSAPATAEPAAAKPAAAAAAPSAPSAPAGIGGMEPHSGASPFSPVAALTGDARLMADLKRAKSEAAGLRQAIVTRERELADARNKLRALEGADPEALKAAREQVAAAQAGLHQARAQVTQAQAMVEETKQQARIKIEELTRLNQALETRLAQGGAADAVALEREVARLREEGRKIQDQGRRRIDQLTLEKAALEAQLAENAAGANAELEAASATKLAEAEARAETAEAKQDELEDRIGGIQSASRELELEVEDLRTQLENATANAANAANAGGGDETQALEAAIAELNEDLAAAKDARREALQALQQKDEEVAALRGASGGGSGVDPAQLIALRNSLAKLEEQNATLEKEKSSLLDKLAVAEARSEESAPGAAPGATPDEALAAELAAAQAALATAQAELSAAREQAPAPTGDSAGLAELQGRVTTLEEENTSLLRDLEEINEDMLAQEEEYQTRISELEAQTGT